MNLKSKKAQRKFTYSHGKKSSPRKDVHKGDTGSQREPGLHGTWDLGKKRILLD